MTDVTVTTVDDCERMYGGAMARLRAALGVTTFGIQAIDLPPNFDHYPEHDHADEDQEEVFTVLEGSATLRLDDEEEVQLEPGTFVRVGPTVRRKIVTEDSAVRILALSGALSGAYEVNDFTELGAPDPLGG